jgi:uncharacterized membrane protein YeiB
MGYYFNKYRDKIKLNIRSNKVFIPMLILYAALMIFWNKDSYIYTTYLSVFKSDNVLRTIGIDLYRWVVGLVGSCCVIMAVDKIYPRLQNTRLSNIFAYLGQQSLGLYILNAYISNYILLKISFFAGWNGAVFTLLCIPLSAVEILASVVIIKVVQKIKPVNFLLFGGR